MSSQAALPEDVDTGHATTPPAFAVPHWLNACALGFWGWQSGEWLGAAGLALAVLLPAFTSLRLALAERDQHRIADLSTLLFIAIAASFVATRDFSHGLLQAFVWLPGALLPVLLAQTMDVSARLPLSALFRYLRKLKRRGEDVDDPPTDLSAVYLAAILLSAGVANRSGAGFYQGAAILVGLALWSRRPRHRPVLPWALTFGLVVLLGHLTQSGMSAAQAAFEDWLSEQRFTARFLDPLRSTTRIGEIGRLKADDAIVARVLVPREAAQRPALLARASYNRYTEGTWIARHAELAPLASSGDGTLWPLEATAGSGVQQRIPVMHRADRGKILLALPQDSVAVSDLVASQVRANRYGAVQAFLEAPWARYTALVERGSRTGSPADAEDLHLPPPDAALLARLAGELGLRELAPAQAIRRVEAHLAQFEYATVRNRINLAGDTPLAEFLTRTRRGHCEYFATAATLLLRAGGVPARYVTGHAVNEWSALENAWIVRERHSHAWARAWVDGRWVEVDATPPDWIGREDALAPIWQQLADLLRWAGYRWTVREGEETRWLAWGVVGIAALVLVWRLLTEGGLIRLAGRGRPRPRHWPGRDSEFYALESRLARRLPRHAGEPLMAWLERAAAGLAPAERAALLHLARLHYRLRFDPAGLDAASREALSSGVAELLPRIARSRPASI
jgi:hypothetical protein